MRNDTNLRDALVELGGRVPVGSFWRHRKGGEYEVIALAHIEATLTPAVVYVVDGTAANRLVWVRPAAEFLDGRFQRI